LSAPDNPAPPKDPSQIQAAAPTPSGVTSLQRGSAPASPVAPPPSLGSTPQPSARAAAPSRPGEDRQDGPVTLAGPAPQAQALQPEFRQASRQGGQTSMRGGSQAPDDGLSRQPGVPGQTAMLAARAVPQAQPGSGLGRGGQPPALAAPVSRTSGQGGVEVAESASRPTQLASAGAAHGVPATQPASGASRSGQSPALAAPPTRGSGQGSVAAAEGASPGNLAQLATSSAGVGAASASRAPSPSGLASSGADSGARAAVPGERGGSGLMAAAAPGASGPGTAAGGAGPGAGIAGEGRAQRLTGSGSAARDAAAPMLVAGGGAAASAGTDSSGGQLSGHAETVALAQPVRETQAVPLQPQRPSGQARVIEERFTATALKVDSPRSICSLPLMFAGLDGKPIPAGLDSINATAARLADETPPRHHPGNQAPRYPVQAIGIRAQGRVLVRAEIRPDGTIGQRWIKQSSGLQVLDQAALETVRLWRFYPAERHGMAVAVWLDVPIEYKLP
jgi:TonB family protein